MHATPRAVFRSLLLGLAIGFQTATADAMQQTNPDAGVSQTLAQARSSLVTNAGYELDFTLTTEGDLVRGPCVLRFTLPARQGP